MFFRKTVFEYFNISGHLPSCVSFTNDNTLHLYKSFILRIFKLLCSLFVGVRLSNCISNFNTEISYQEIINRLHMLLVIEFLIQD